MTYALITGASKGIGKAMAEILAAKKVNLLLVARSGDLLKKIAGDLARQYGVTTDYLVSDLAEPTAAARIFAWTQEKGYIVDTLINNAGYGLSGSFERYTAEEHNSMMQVNMNVPVELCALYIPQLKQQSKAYILNIASSAAYQSVPGLTAYAASKAFVLSFSRGLNYELRKTSVSVTVISPGATDTDFPNRAKVGTKALKAGEKLNMTPEAVAKIAIGAMYAGKTEAITGFVNKLGAFFVWLLPKKLVEGTAAGIYDMH
jgi:short-subunit dehydrogenase